MPFPLRDIRKKSSQYVRACDGAICLKIEKLSHIMWPTPILEMARAYGLRPRLCLLQRHMNSKNSDSNFAPVIPMSQEKCQRFQLVHSFTCMVAGLTGSGKNCLGTITVTTSSNLDWSTTGENNLMLLTVANRLHAIVDEDTNNRICQGDPVISGKWFLFRSQHTQPDCHWRHNDWSWKR